MNTSPPRLTWPWRNRWQAWSRPAINKEALNLAGFHYSGHTEIFAERTGTPKVGMMLASGHFRVTHVSTHCSLREAVERCVTPRILEVIHITHNALLQMGIENPRLAVAGLNPHSGEGGLFGREEIEQIQPAIDAARREGLDVYPSPVPGDTVFLRMQKNKAFDAGDRAVPRPGAYRRQDRGFLRRGEYHPGAAHHPHLGGSRHRLRYRRERVSPTPPACWRPSRTPSSCQRTVPRWADSNTLHEKLPFTGKNATIRLC